TAAVFSENQFADWLSGAPHGSSQREQFVHGGNSGLDRFANAADALDGHKRRRKFAGSKLIELKILDHELNLVDLTAKTDHDVAADVRMAGNAGEHSLQELVRAA